MRSIKTKGKKHANPRNLDILYSLYKYRALSTSQIRKMYDYGKWYVYEKMETLREWGLVSNHPISGNYIPNQRRQGDYHRITGKGITLLKENGYQCDYEADELRVAKHRLPYLLTANDLYLALRDTGWHYKESREIKSFHGKSLNRNDVLQGTLTNPRNNKEYALYILLKSIRHDALYRIKQEISRISFENVLVTTRGEESFNAITKAFRDKEDKLIKGGSVKVLPFGFAEKYLNISNDVPEHYAHFMDQLGIEVVSALSDKSNFESSVSFDYLIRHNGEEMYFMDLLDNDLMKLDELTRYRKEDYEREGKKVLVLTSTIDAHRNFHEGVLGNPEHIEYFTLNPNEVVAFSDALSNKSDFE